MQKQHYIITFLFFLLLGGLNKASAQEMATNYATAEDIAIVFYKTGGIVPNFKNWVKERAPYNLTPIGQRPRVMKEELLRLNTAYKNFDLEKDFLVLRTNAYLEPKNERRVVLDKDGIKEEKFEYSLNISFDQSKDVTYFPYEFLDQSIMVIPSELEDLKITALNELDYKRIRAYTTGKAFLPLIIKLRPTKADFDQPYEVDGHPQWAFTTEIVSMETWNPNGALLWEYSAPWYVSPNSQKIKILFDAREERDAEFDEGNIIKDAP